MKLKEFARKKLKHSLYHSAYSRSSYTLYGIVIKEIRLSFRQFYTWKYPLRSLSRTITIILSSLARMFLGRSVKYSFAFTGEDRIIESLLKPLITDNGYYVDVGCNHPKFLSNTYNLYRRGWTGICIDANADLIKQYALYRPKDTAIQALVSSKSEERTFYLSENDVLSTTETSNLQDFDDQGLTYKRVQLYTRTLTSILDKNNCKREFDLLSIDAEEHDFQVLISLDFDKYRPKLIVIEDETFDIYNSIDNPIDNFMRSKSYRLIGVILKNLYYIPN